MKQSIPTLSAIGMLSWDTTMRLTDYPPEGGWTSVLSTHFGPGGTTANSAVTAARLGARVALFGAVGGDDVGDRLLQALGRENLDLDGIQHLPDGATDQTTLLVSDRSQERTILWNRGARLERGSPLPIQPLFAADCCLIDADDYDLTRFLVDLPVHTSPNTRLLGTLTYLADSDAPDVIETAFRFDTLVGSIRQLMAVLSIDHPDLALADLQRRITGSNLRQAFITDGANGAFGVDAFALHHVPAVEVDSVDTTGAGDAFCGAIAFGMAKRWKIELMLSFASGTAALSTTALGAQSALPTMEAVMARLDGQDPSAEIIAKAARSSDWT